MTPKCLPKRTRQKRRKGGGREKSGRRGGGREREGKWGERERKSVGNFNLPRVTKRLATPRIATACWIRNRTFRSTCTKKKRGGKIVAIEARCGCGRAYTHTRTHTRIRTHVYAHASMVASIGWLPLRRVETSLHRFRVEAARSLDFYSISFHLSPLPPPRSSLSRRLPPSPSRFPFHAIDFPFAKRKNVSSATPIHRPGGEELNFAGWISRWNDDLRVQIRLRRLQ